MWDFLYYLLFNTVPDSQQAVAFLVVLGAVVFGGQQLLQYFPPLGHILSRKTNRLYPNLLPAMGDIVRMRYRGLIDTNQFNIWSRENGYHENTGEIFFKAAKQLLDADMYMRLFRRGLIDRNELTTKLIQLQITDDDIEKFEKATEYFPSPADLVQFAVREVYSPEIVEKYGQKEDLPDEFIQEASKTGLPKEQAVNYWAAHWNLPSATQGFEMFHRGVIKEEELKDLLRALDVMPYWRDALMKISYNLLTRVDVRRMHKIGVISTDEVYQQYLKYGYSPEDAERMTEFTVMYNTDTEETETKSRLDDAYDKGYLSKDEYEEAIKEVTGSEAAAKYWAQLLEYDKVVRENEESIENILVQFRKATITQDEAQNQLTALNLKATHIEDIMKKELRRSGYQVKLPSKTDLIDWYKKDIITELEFKDRMKRLGYLTEDIQHYIDTKTGE